MFRKVCAIIMALMITAGMMTCSSAEESNQYILAGFDSNTSRDWKTNAFFERLSNLTGFQFELKQYSDKTVWKNAKASMNKNDSDLPDVMFMADLSGDECISLIEKGVLIDLKPYLRECCPSLCALLDQFNGWDAITLPDGSIAALPYINETPLNCTVLVNKKWLTNCRLDMPEDIDSFTEMLRTFKTRDGNKNGSDDEIPLAFLGSFDLKFLAHAWGLVANDYNIYLDKNGLVQFMPLQDTYRDFVQWCVDAYKEGLLDPNGFSTNDTLRTVSDSSKAQVYGAVIATSIGNFLPSEWIEDYVPMTPLSYNGEKIYRDYFGHIKTGTFAITTHCDDPEKLLRMIDIMYTEQGAVLASIGAENSEYLVKGDGRWYLANESNMSNIQITQLISGSTAYPGYSCNSFQALYHQDTIMNQLDMYNAFNQYTIRPFPYYYLNQKQCAYITPLQNAIGREVDMQLARWVNGEDLFDEASYQTFINKLYDLGLDQFVSFWQDIVK